MSNHTIVDSFGFGVLPLAARIREKNASNHIIPILARTRVEMSIDASPEELQSACHEMILNLLALTSVVQKMKTSHVRDARLARAGELMANASVHVQWLCETLGETAHLLGV